MKTLKTFAKVIRSKNSSPFELTLDILFHKREDYDRAKERRLIGAHLIASTYGVSAKRIKSVIYFDPGKAVKVSLQRNVPSGSSGDTDVYGAQQHAPLLELEVDL